MRLVYLFFAGVLVVLSSGFVSALQDPFLVYGTVKYEDGAAASGVDVSVLVNGVSKSLVSDDAGKYSVVLDEYGRGDAVVVSASVGGVSVNGSGTVGVASGGLQVDLVLPVEAPGVAGGEGKKSPGVGVVLAFLVFVAASKRMRVHK